MPTKPSDEFVPKAELDDLLALARDVLYKPSCEVDAWWDSLRNSADIILSMHSEAAKAAEGEAERCPSCHYTAKQWETRKLYQECADKFHDTTEPQPTEVEPPDCPHCGQQTVNGYSRCVNRKCWRELTEPQPPAGSKDSSPSPDEPRAARQHGPADGTGAQRLDGQEVTSPSEGKAISANAAETSKKEHSKAATGDGAGDPAGGGEGQVTAVEAKKGLALIGWSSASLSTDVVERYIEQSEREAAALRAEVAELKAERDELVRLLLQPSAADSTGEIGKWLRARKYGAPVPPLRPQQSPSPAKVEPASPGEDRPLLPEARGHLAKALGEIQRHSNAFGHASPFRALRELHMAVEVLADELEGKASK